MITIPSNQVLNDPIAEYLSNFEHHIVLNCGQSYSPEFKEVYAWCERHLGVKYKDWHMVSGSRKQQTLHVKDTKWITMLQLTFPELIVSSYKL